MFQLPLFVVEGNLDAAWLFRSMSAQMTVTYVGWDGQVIGCGVEFVDDILSLRESECINATR